jgi:hypothetical protein
MSKPIRIVVAVLTAELVPILLLVAVIAAFSTGSAAGDQALAGRAGRWIGPIAGVGMTFLMAWWAARSQPGAERKAGLLIGVLTAATDVSILVVTVTPFERLFLFSNGLRVVAGVAGGILAARR